MLLWEARRSIRRAEIGHSVGCSGSTCHLSSTSHPDQTQQALQNKHPSALWDSQHFLGHSSDTNDLDTRWVWIIQGLEGPNEAFMECFNRIMNCARSGEVRYDQIDSTFHWMAINKADEMGNGIPFFFFFFLSCWLLSCAVILKCVKIRTPTISRSNGTRAWCPQLWPRDRETRA